MSVIRRSDPNSRGVYIYELGNGGAWHCQGCPMVPEAEGVILLSRTRAAWHVVKHWLRGDITRPLFTIRKIGRC